MNSRFLYFIYRNKKGKTHMVLAVIGWFFMGLLILLLLLLLVPVTLKVNYANSKLVVWARVLVVPLKVFPMNLRFLQGTKRKKKTKQKKEPDKQQEQKEAEDKTAKQKKKMTPTDIITLVQRIAETASEAAKWALRGVWVRKTDICIPASGGDAAAIAINYGKLQIIIGTARAVISNIVSIKFKRLVVIPDFENRYKDELTFSCKIVISPVIMLIACVAGLLKFVFFKKTWYKRKPAGENKTKPKSNANGSK